MDYRLLLGWRQFGLYTQKRMIQRSEWKFPFYSFVLSSWRYVHFAATSYFSMPSSVMIVRVERKRKAIFILTCAVCSLRYGAINSITARSIHFRFSVPCWLNLAVHGELQAPDLDSFSSCLWTSPMDTDL